MRTLFVEFSSPTTIADSKQMLNSILGLNYELIQEDADNDSPLFVHLGKNKF